MKSRLVKIVLSYLICLLVVACMPGLTDSNSTPETIGTASPELSAGSPEATLIPLPNKFITVAQ